MKRTRVTVRYAHGLHARIAVSLIRSLKRFKCQVLLRAGDRVASASSILSVLMLAATFNTQVEIEAFGEDEDAAIGAAEVFFQNHDETALEQARSDVLPPQGSAGAS